MSEPVLVWRREGARMSIDVEESAERLYAWLAAKRLEENNERIDHERAEAHSRQ